MSAYERLAEVMLSVCTDVVYYGILHAGQGKIVKRWEPRLIIGGKA